MTFLVIAVLTTLVPGAAPGPNNDPRCSGRPASITGSPRRDVLRGSAGSDVIVAAGGRDVVEGGDGDDRLCGQGGGDALRGGNGSDVLSGGLDRDTLDGDDGDDLLSGGRGVDACFQGLGVGGSVSCAPVVAAAGDIACEPWRPVTPSECRMQSTSDLLLRTNLAAVLALGDLQYEDGEYTNFLASYGPTWGRVKSITRPAPGNHEYGTPGADGYFRYFGASAGDPSLGVYSFELGDWHAISLNSNCAEVGGCEETSPQGTWLAQDLAAHPAPCTLAFWHHPRFSSGWHGDDPSVGPLWRLLDAAGGDLILSGHDHDYERFAPQTPDGNPDPTGIREFVAGTGGRSLRGFGPARPNSEVRNAEAFGILEIALLPGGYAWRFVAVDSPFTDLGAELCH